jgi:hypothetical protein
MTKQSTNHLSQKDGRQRRFQVHSLMMWAMAVFSTVPVIAAKAPDTAYYTPSSSLFTYIAPAGWQIIEGREETHPAVHMLGPDEPLGLYRTGLDVHYFEKGDPGFISLADKLLELRRSDKLSQREITNVRPVRVSGSMALTFEVTEKKWLPIEELPLSQQYVHRYVALIPDGKNYFIATLSSARTVYIDDRNIFSDFLRSFRTMGSPSK